MGGLRFTSYTCIPSVAETCGHILQHFAMAVYAIRNIVTCKSTIYLTLATRTMIACFTIACSHTIQHCTGSMRANKVIAALCSNLELQELVPLLVLTSGPVPTRRAEASRRATLDRTRSVRTTVDVVASRKFVFASRSMPPVLAITCWVTTQVSAKSVAARLSVTVQDELLRTSRNLFHTY